MLRHEDKLPKVCHRRAEQSRRRGEHAAAAKWEENAREVERQNRSMLERFSEFADPELVKELTRSRWSRLSGRLPGR